MAPPVVTELERLQAITAELLKAAKYAHMVIAAGGTYSDSEKLAIKKLHDAIWHAEGL